MKSMKTRMLLMLLAVGYVTPLYGQVENPDFRIRAQFRDDLGESVGNATVKVISRFQQVYYGGVTRQDEYRFQLSLDSPQYANRSFDVKVNDFLVGNLNTNSNGYLDVTYRSDFHAGDEPDLPLPVGFPDPIDVGHTASIFDALNGNLVLSGIFGEDIRRGDSNDDGDVDDLDRHNWEDHYGLSGLGPANGDYSGDNRVDGRDFLVWQRNHTGSHSRGGGHISAVPEPSTLLIGGIAALLTCMSRRRRT